MREWFWPDSGPIDSDPTRRQAIGGAKIRPSNAVSSASRVSVLGRLAQLAPNRSVRIHVGM
jgi:hypothetical protein